MMCWADRLAITLAAFIYVVIFLMFLPNVSGYFEIMLSFAAIKAMVLILLPIWLFLRLCRLMTRAGKAH